MEGDEKVRLKSYSPSTVTFLNQRDFTAPNHFSQQDAQQCSFNNGGFELWKWCEESMKPWWFLCFLREQRPLLWCRCKCAPTFYTRWLALSFSIFSFASTRWEDSPEIPRACKKLVSSFSVSNSSHDWRLIHVLWRFDCVQEWFSRATITTIHLECISPCPCSWRSYGRSSKQAWSLTCSRSSEWALPTG